MGQFALGIRSLLIRTAVFVIMAALLAWALGGTLWPKPSRALLPAASLDGRQWYWRVSVFDGMKPDNRSPVSERMQWQLVEQQKSGKILGMGWGQNWCEVAGPIVASGLMYFGGMECDASARNWVLYTIRDREMVDRKPMPDRLAVEQQLARFAAGLPIQDAQTILQQRAAVLDPKPNSADGV